MSSRGRFSVLATSVVVAATAAVGSVVGIAVNEATDQPVWPWPFSLMQDHPWRWTGVLLLLTVSLAVVMWRVTTATAAGEESGGNQATAAGGRVAQMGDGAQNFANAIINNLHFDGRVEKPAAEPSVDRASRTVPGTVMLLGAVVISDHRPRPCPTDGGGTAARPLGPLARR